MAPLLGEFNRQRDIFQRRQGGNQIEELKDEADLAVADIGELALAHARDVHAVDGDGAAGGAVQAADDPQQRTFPAARGPDDADHFVTMNLELHAAQGVYDVRAQF